MTARSAELASVPDDQLDALDKKQEEFGKLVDQRITLPAPRSHRDRQILEYRELLLGSLGALPAQA